MTNLKYADKRAKNENGELVWRNRGYYRITDTKKAVSSRSLMPGEILQQYIPVETYSNLPVEGKVNK